jgi:hypothetical protein
MFVPLQLHVVLEQQVGLCHLTGLDKVGTQSMVGKCVQPPQYSGPVLKDTVLGKAKLNYQLVCT